MSSATSVEGMGLTVFYVHTFALGLGLIPLATIPHLTFTTVSLSEYSLCAIMLYL